MCKNQCMKGPNNNVFLEFEKIKDLNSGLGQVCLNLGEELINYAVSEKLSLNFYLPKQQVGIFGHNQKYHKVSKFHRALSYLLPECSIWHSIHQDSPYLPNTKNILTIHDLNFLDKNKSDSYKKRRIKKLQKRINKADAITTISKFTLDTIKEYLEIPNIPVKVIYNGHHVRQFPHATRPSFVPDGEFFFTIGIIAPKKNFHVLVEFLKRTNKNLIIAGRASNPYVNKIKDLANKHNLEKRIIIPGIIDEPSKFWLYKHCHALLFPSLNEGFGLPVLEAMGHGRPVFISKMTSLPEIGGREAYYFDDFDPDVMFENYQEGIKDYINNQNQKQKRLKEWAQSFSWKNAAVEYLKLYNEIIKS